jgi:hypothetical protein
MRECQGAKARKHLTSKYLSQKHYLCERHVGDIWLVPGVTPRTSQPGKTFAGT